jgi:hypothetical protein
VAAVAVRQFFPSPPSAVVLGGCGAAAILDVFFAIWVLRNCGRLVVTADEITFTPRRYDGADGAGQRPVIRHVAGSTLSFRTARNGPMGSKYTGYVLKRRDDVTGDEVFAGAFGRRKVQQAGESQGWSFAAACTGSAGNNAILRTDPSATPTMPTVATKCCVEPEEPQLAITVSPTSGAPGTAVRVLVTGCGVADPADKATVSFNNDALDVGARNDRDTVRLVKTRQRGTGARGTYTVVRRDRTGGLGMFFVQCGQTLRQTRFKVTG